VPTFTDSFFRTLRFWLSEVIAMSARASALPKKQPRRSEEEPRPALEEQIRRRAYEIYIQRGGQSGSETDDWLQAEAEMNAVSTGR
jgi:hypothetical protein